MLSPDGKFSRILVVIYEKICIKNIDPDGGHRTRIETDLSMSL